MRGFVVVKNIKAPLEDITSVDDVPEKNIDYTLLVDVSLLEKRVKQVEENEEDEDITFIFQPTGRIHLVRTPQNGYTENPHFIEDGHIETDTPGDS